MKTALTLTFAFLLLIKIGLGESLQKVLYQTNSMSRLNICDLLNEEGDIQAISCHPDAMSGKVQILGGGFTDNKHGQLISSGSRRFQAKEFGMLKPLFSFSEGSDLKEVFFEWNIDPDVGLRSKRWTPFDYKFFQDGGCGIVRLNENEPMVDHLVLIAAFPCEWNGYLQEAVEIINLNQGLFCSDLLSTKELKELEQIATDESNPALSYYALRRLIALDSIGEDKLFEELRRSKGIKLSLLAHSLIRMMDTDTTGSLIFSYLDEEAANVDRVAVAAFVAFSENSENISRNKYNRNQETVSGQKALTHPIYRANQDYLEQQMSYQILLKIKSFDILSELSNEIMRRGYF